MDSIRQEPKKELLWSLWVLAFRILDSPKARKSYEEHIHVLPGALRLCFFFFFFGGGGVSEKTDTLFRDLNEVVIVFP